MLAFASVTPLSLHYYYNILKLQISLDNILIVSIEWSLYAYVIVMQLLQMIGCYVCMHTWKTRAASLRVYIDKPYIVDIYYSGTLILTGLIAWVRSKEKVYFPANTKLTMNWFIATHKYFDDGWEEETLLLRLLIWMDKP